MNFLAHCLLSCDDEWVLVGNFVADFIRNREVADFSPAVQAGILLHRRIDQYTDAHPVVRRSTERVRAAHRKYAPVVVDIYYDHLLATQWSAYHGVPLAEFAMRQYQVLEQHLDLMPERLRARLPGMIAGDWLVQYGQLDGLAYTFERLRTRLSRPEQLDGVMTTLAREHEGLLADFEQFFPEIQQYVRRQCLQLTKG